MNKQISPLFIFKYFPTLSISQYFGKFLPKNEKLNNRTGKSWFENTKEVIEMLSKTNG